MQLDLQAPGLVLRTELRDHVASRLRSVLSRCAARIRHVSIRLRDVNGPRGGMDKRCSIKVELENAGAVRIEETGSELRSLIDRAMERTGRNVFKRLDRATRPTRTRKPLPDNELSELE